MIRSHWYKNIVYDICQHQLLLLPPPPSHSKTSYFWHLLEIYGVVRVAWQHLPSNQFYFDVIIKTMALQYTGSNSINSYRTAWPLPNLDNLAETVNTGCHITTYLAACYVKPNTICLVTVWPERLGFPNLNIFLHIKVLEQSESHQIKTQKKSFENINLMWDILFKNGNWQESPEKHILTTAIKKK